MSIGVLPDRTEPSFDTLTVLWGLIWLWYGYSVHATKLQSLCRLQ